MNRLFYLLCAAWFMLAILPANATLNYMNLMTTITGEFNGCNTGYAMTSLDFNGDGFKDLVVASSGWNPSGHYSIPLTVGRIDFYMGGAGFDNTPEYTISGSFYCQYTISEFQNLGDVNGDGKDDLGATTAPRPLTGYTYDQTSFYLFYGRDIPSSTPDLAYHFPYEPVHSVILYALGDINSDGYNDVGLTLLKFSARSYSDYKILWGNSTTLVQYYHGTTNNEEYMMNGIGDVNGDGIDDYHLFYNAHYSDYHDVSLTVYYGSTDFPNCDSLSLVEHQTNRPSCYACPVGDFNGDGTSDFISNISANAKLWLGSPNLSAQYNILLSFEWYPAQYSYGWGLYPGFVYGDFNGDDCDDIAAGDYEDGGWNGQIGVWIGGHNPNGSMDYSRLSPELGKQFGWALATGDFNGDGLCDLAVSAPLTYGDAVTTPGKVYIYSGNTDMHETTVDIGDEFMAPETQPDWSISVYPNPMSYNSVILNIDLSGAAYKSITKAKLEVFNIKGQLVFSGIVDSSELTNGKLVRQLPHLPSGLYFVKISDKDRTLNKKRFTIIR